MANTATAELFAHLVEIIAQLRNPEGGCPWDLEQDHQSLRPYLIEEAYEVLDAINKADDSELSGELGDVLLQVVLHAQVAKDRGAFDIDEVVKKVSAKMIRRHPHVFGSTKVSGSADVLKNWENIKLAEGGGEKQSAASVLNGIPDFLPALLRAQRLGEKAAKYSFDWKTLGGVWDKVEEEIGELQNEIVPHLASKSALPPKSENRAELEHELGDLLFSLCQLARWSGLSAEDALRSASSRFLERFTVMEQQASKPLDEYSESELEELWQNAKHSIEVSRRK